MKGKGKGVGIGVVLLAALGLYIWSQQADGEPPVFTCPYCGATFASQALLDAHIELEHPEEPPPVFTCPYCGATFASQALLDAHIELEHPEEPPQFYWLRPTGHIANGWNDAELAYDGWTDTRAEVVNVGTQSWSPYLEFSIAPTEISAVRWWGSSPVSPKKVQVDVISPGGAYQNIYEGDAVVMWENGLPIPGGARIISGTRIRFYNPARTVRMKFRVNEFQFFGYAEAPPEPPTPPPTTNLTGYVTNKLTGVPIPGATGTVYQDKGTDTWDHDLITNAAGYYEIIGMIDDADQNLMVIYAGGYQPYTDEHVTISEGDNQLDIQMEPAWQKR